MAAYRWCTPPRWPSPPFDFRPSPSWQPPPAWPSPPDRWRWWRLSQGLWLGLTLGALGSLVVGLGLLGLGISGGPTHAAYVARHDRGVTIEAQILSSHYDAGGGDPGGWTEQTVAIQTPTGRINTRVGHHYQDPAGAAPTTVAVIYDPLNPSNAQSMQDYQEYGDYSPAVANIAFAAAGGLFLLASLAMLIFLAVACLRRPASMST